MKRYRTCVLCGFLLVISMATADPLPQGVFVDSSSDLRFSQYPSVRFLTSDRAELTWATPDRATAEVRVGSTPARLSKVGTSTSRFILNGLPRGGKVYYQLVVHGKKSIAYPLETTCNYAPPRLSARATSRAQSAKRYLDAASRKQPALSGRGYCVVLGGDAELLLELARQSEMTVVGLFLDAKAAASARAFLYRHKSYGTRAQVFALPHFGNLPVRSNFATLVIRRNTEAGARRPTAADITVKPRLHWVFTPDRRGADGSFQALQGGLKATPTSKGEVRKSGPVEGYVLDGKNYLNISSGKARDGLPAEQMTAEAWVRIDKPLKWGGIIGAFQDNGSYEKGWLLGYQDHNFSFAVKSVKTKALTYMKTPQPFHRGKWTHVVGTYDGATMKLYVNGKAVATSTAQSGPIDYAPENFFDIGCYHDSNEKNPMTGAVHEVRLYDRVLGDADVRRRYSSNTKLVTPLDKSGRTEVKRIVRPGGVLITDAGSFKVQAKPALRGSGAWTHEYASPANTACSRDELSGARSVGDLSMQWLGRPGGNFGVDRNPRMPAPLAVDGRLFHQGMGRITALDAYNGAVLWNLEIPDLRRFNVPRDSGNWCTAPGCDLYVVVKDQLWQIAPQTGEVRRSTPVPDTGCDWGYLACDGEQVYASTVRRGAAYMGWWGGANWYDRGNAASTAKVVSNRLIAMDLNGKSKWTYRSNAIINPTIAIDQGRVYLVDANKPNLKGSRIGAKDLDACALVALDARSGRKVWARKLDIVRGDIVFYGQSCAEGIVLTTSAGGNYHIYLFDHKTGARKWHATHRWPANNHSGHMMHPVIVKGRIYLEPYGYNLSDGSRLPGKIGSRSGCHTYLASANALIYRGAGRQLAMWGLETKQVSTWQNLRPSCWLSAVPGCGMLLAPEGGGGCSCGRWLETSIAFGPWGE